MSGSGLPPVSFADGLTHERQAKGDARNNSRTLFISGKTEFIFSKEYDTINAVENDLFYYIEIFYNRKRSTHMGIGTHYKNTYQST